MKSAKLLLAGMYLHLLLSIAVVLVLIFFIQEPASGLFFIFYLFMIAVVLCIGWIAVAMSYSAYNKGQYLIIKKSWKLLKIGGIPFYILNFIYSFVVWFCLVGASRGLMLILVPIPIIITYSFIIQSGCIGAFYIRRLRKNPNIFINVNAIHYLLQFISILDIISTIVLLRKYESVDECF